MPIRSPFSVSALVVLAALVPASAQANSPVGHADRSQYVEVMKRGNLVVKLHTSSCRLAITDTATPRAKSVKVSDLTENATFYNLQCRPGKSGCVTNHGSGAASWTPPISGLDHDEERLQTAALQCSVGMVSGADHFDWHWRSGSAAANTSLTSSSKRRFARDEFRRGVLRNPPSNAVDFGSWQRAAPKGICRVRFFGADYLGTIEHTSTDNAVSGQTKWGWSTSKHRYVSSSLGTGTKCRVRFTNSSINGVPDIGSFKHFDVLRAPDGHRWSNYTPGATVPSDAVVLGTRRNKAVYACRVRETFFGPKNHTQGLQLHHRDYAIGYYVDGSNECVAPDTKPYGANVKIQILRNPI